MYSVIVNYVYNEKMELVEICGKKMFSYEELKDYVSGLVGVEKIVLDEKEISVDELIEYGLENSFELDIQLVEDGYGYEEDCVFVYEYCEDDSLGEVVFKIERV
jgi:hypothetical protein